MSGGSFDYAYCRVNTFADELSEKLDSETEFEPEVIGKLRMIESYSRKAAMLMKEAEWLYSGDTGEDSFMKRVAVLMGEV